MFPHLTRLVASHEAVVPRQTECQTGRVGHQLNKWRPVVEQWSSMLICQRPAVTQRRPSFSSNNFTIGQPKSKHSSSSRLEASSVVAVLNFKFTSDHLSGNGSLLNSDRGCLSGDAARLNFTRCQYRGNAAALNQS